MSGSAELVTVKVDRVEDGGHMGDDAIAAILNAKTEAQAHVAPELSVLYIPVLPVVGHIVKRMIERVIGWLDNASDKHTPSEYNPLE